MSAELTQDIVVPSELRSYQEAIEKASVTDAEQRLDALLGVLILRTRIAKIIAESPYSEPAIVGRLVDADQRLQVLTQTLSARIGDGVFKQWREALSPLSSQWWWFLDDRIAAEEQKKRIFPALISLISVSVAIGFLSEILRRFFIGGPGLWSIATQSLILLLAGGAFTKIGQDAIEIVFLRLGVRPWNHSRWKAVLGILLLLFSAVFFFSLPVIANHLVRSAADAHTDQDLKNAVKKNELAISLNPECLYAHYNLASLYIKLHKFDKAEDEYKMCLQLNPIFYQAYNGLAYLYLRRGGEDNSISALALTRKALEKLSPGGRIEDDPNTLCALYKNQGWAHFNLKLYDLAEKDLRNSLNAYPDGMAANYLMAQVLEAQKKNGAAEQWTVSGKLFDVCKSNPETGECDKQLNQMAPAWISLMQQRLAKRR